MLVCAIAATYSGYNGLSAFSIPAIGAVWILGSWLFKGNVMAVTNGKPLGFVFRIWIFNSAQVAILYAIGYSISFAMG